MNRDNATQLPGNLVSDVLTTVFTIRLFCDAWGRQADLDLGNVPTSLTIPELTRRLRCAACGRRNCFIRDFYAEAGGFRHA